MVIRVKENPDSHVFLFELLMRKENRKSLNPSKISRLEELNGKQNGRINGPNPP